MISGFSLITERGDVLISRTFRDDVEKDWLKKFKSHIVVSKEEGVPIRPIDDRLYSFKRYKSIFAVAVTASNANSLLFFEFIDRFWEILTSYFGESIDEDVIRDNFTLVYELLDEAMDYGYPQVTDYQVLKMYINRDGSGGQLKSKDANKITIKATGVVSWRPEGIKYRKNQAIVDVREEVNCLISSHGELLKAEVVGSIYMNSSLSGMPECKIGLNDSLRIRDGRRPSTRKTRGIGLDDIAFHQCVRLSEFEQNRTISFIPPDGKFRLASYRVTENIKLPFQIASAVKTTRTRSVYDISIKSLYSSSDTGENIWMKVPVPEDAVQVESSVLWGRSKYVPGENAVIWKIGHMQGKKHHRISIKFRRMKKGKKNNKSGQEAKRNIPISLQFDLPMVTASGLQIRYLKVSERSITSVEKWVKYITVQHGDNYLVRI